MKGMNDMQAQTATNAKTTKSKASAAAVAKPAPTGKSRKARKEVAPITMAKQSGEVRNFPLSQLVHSPLNVRTRKRSPESLEELAALIYSQSILQNLIGYLEKRKGKETGKIAIAAGGGRLDACNLLHARGQIDADYPVPVKLVSEEEAIAASLAENSGREPMHLADQYIAMRNMVEEQGRHIDEVAAAFGMTPLRVKRRLALSNVSPRLFGLFRDEKMSYEQLMQFTLTTDHKLQEQVWDSAPVHNRQPHYLRQLLTKQEISIKRDPLAKFVGVEAYEQAGGAVRKDLFSDDNDGFMKDAALLEDLAIQRLAPTAHAVKAAGAAWVEIRPRASWSDINAYEHAETMQRDPTEQERAELDAMNDQIRKIDEALTETEDDDEIAALEEQREQTEGQIVAFEAKLEITVPEHQALAGAIVRVDERGSIAVHKGLVRSEDKKALKAANKAAAIAAATARGEPAPAEAEKATHSERLTRQLTAHRTAALQAMVATHPNIALVVMTHRMVKSIFASDLYSVESVCQVSVTETMLTNDADDMKESRAWLNMQAKRDEWRKRLPLKKKGLFLWLLDQPLEVILSLMSFCVGCSINAVQSREGKNQPADELAQALSLDMADWWTATAESYFSHVPKARIAEVVTEAVSPDVGKTIEAMKKKDAAAAAEKAVEGKRWVPEMFRVK
ncbi:chromosome partitioning protein ParB [Herbaspirillum sp. HC18]|nr:chromosome partitioning protein ParB [Herbaspirillum sp. HC18]